MKFAYSNFDIVIISDVGVRTVGLDHPFYVDICKAIQKGDEQRVAELLDAKKEIEARALEKVEKIMPGQDVTVQANAEDPNADPDIIVDGMPITGKLAGMIMRFKKKGIPIKALKLFWKRVQANPLLVGKESMLDFLQNNAVPLLPDGTFLAYKGVNSTDDPKVFASCHDASFLYTLGKPAGKERSECTVDVNNACGPGLHVGGFNHAKGYGNTILDCVVDPADVVSVPSAENCKLRACKVLPVRVNMDRKVHEAQYLDLAKETMIVNPGAEHRHAREEQERCKSVRADTKKSGGRSKKTTWYKQVGKLVQVQRKVKCPGPEWIATKPAQVIHVPQGAGKTRTVLKAISKPAKRLALKGGAEVRTWYKRQPNGTLDRVRAAKKPTGYSSHKPA